MDNWKPNPKDFKRVWKPNFIDPKEVEERNKRNDEELIKSLDTSDFPRKVYLFSKSGIEGCLGIPLSIIELRGLQFIIKDVIEKSAKNNAEVTSHMNLTLVITEVQAVFLKNFYNTSFDELHKTFPPEKDKDGNEIWPTEIMHEWFQREQAKLHNEV